VTKSVEVFLQQVLKFRDAREWGKFHTLRNLIISVGIEAGELLETIQWKDDEQIERAALDVEQRAAIEHECADLFIYLLLIAHRAGFDLVQAGIDKLQINAQRYPVEKAKGSAVKYNKL
jgi:NTP pyrophosphatase (non-canonical NTP hydrolase)